MKAKLVRLNRPILIPGHVRSEDVLSSDKQKGMDLTFDTAGVFGSVGGINFFIPFSNIQVVVFAEASNGTKP